MGMISGTPRLSQFVAVIGGEKYFLATPTQTAQVDSGARAWDSSFVPAQDTDTPFDPSKELEIAITDFSQGAGFSFADLPGAYDFSQGWDTSAPGKITTWPQLATGASFVVTNYRGWFFNMGNFVYAARGRYVVKYAIDATPAAVWPILEIHDLGSGNVISGRPVIFNGKAYIPIIAGPLGAEQASHELTTSTTTIASVQVVTITGTPTGGTYTLSYDSKVTAAIAYNANQATVQAALRLIPGLENVTVVTTGTTPNFVHTITLTGAAATLAASVPSTLVVADSTTGGTHAIAVTTTTTGTADTWNKFATNTHRGFWVNLNRLVGATGASIRFCSASPIVDANWGGLYAVGDPGQNINDIGQFVQFLLVGKPEGMFSFDDAYHANAELPDLGQVNDPQNFFGMTNGLGYMFAPHKAGLIRWHPGGYQNVGTEQEGMLDGKLSPAAYGRVADLASYGKFLFYCFNPSNNVYGGVIAALLPPHGSAGRQPHTPHTFQQAPTLSTYEALVVVQSETQPIRPVYAGTGVDDSTVGTIVWTNPGNVTADDGSYAVAAAGTTHYVKTEAYGEAVPANATILGIVVEVNRNGAV